MEKIGLDEIVKMANQFVMSGYFGDVTEPQAVTRIIAGQELGFAPVASMTNINPIKGKLTMSAAGIGAQIKRSDKYDYQVTVHTETECAIEFTQNGKHIGTSTFSMKDAHRAGLSSSPMYQKFPRNLLLARALSNGARFYTPDVFSGPVYTPDELDTEPDETLYPAKPNVKKTHIVVSSEEEPAPMPEPTPTTIDPMAAQHKSAIKARLEEFDIPYSKQVVATWGKALGATDLPSMHERLDTLSARIKEAGYNEPEEFLSALIAVFDWGAASLADLTEWQVKVAEHWLRTGETGGHNANPPAFG